MFWVYILKSLKTDKYYVGQTNSIERRFKDHNCGKDHSSKVGRPWVLKISIPMTSRKEAMRLERSLKNYKSQKRIEEFIYRGVEQQ